MDVSEVFFVGFSLLFATSDVGFRIIYLRVILL